MSKSCYWFIRFDDVKDYLDSFRCLLSNRSEDIKAIEPNTVVV